MKSETYKRFVLELVAGVSVENSGFQCANNRLYKDDFTGEKCGIRNLDKSDIQEPNNV